MSNVISSFLVGIGFDYDRKGADQIGSGIDSIKSKALQLGAVVAGAFGIKALTVDFAESKSMLGRFAEVFGVTANEVQALGNAMASEGGSLDSFMSQLAEIERRRARIRTGDVGWFPAAAKAFVNPNDIANAKNAAEAFRILAKAMQGADQKGRILIGEAFGLDEPAIVLLSKGVEHLDSLVAKYKEIRPITKEMTESAAEFNRNLLESRENIGGIADAISSVLLPRINDASKSLNDWFGINRDEKLKTVTNITEGAADAAGFIVENPSIMIGGLSILLSRMLDSEIEKREFKQRTPFKPKINESIESDAPLLMDVNPPEASDVRPNYGRGGQPSKQSKESQNPPQAQNNTTQKIDISLNLDGTVLDRRTVSVVNGIAQTTLDDLTSSVLS
jgi:hypothetical protein